LRDRRLELAQRSEAPSGELANRDGARPAEANKADVLTDGVLGELALLVLAKVGLTQDRDRRTSAGPEREDRRPVVVVEDGEGAARAAEERRVLVLRQLDLRRRTAPRTPDRVQAV